MNTNDIKRFLLDLINFPEQSQNVDVVLEKYLGIYKELIDKIKQATPSERLKIKDSLIELGTFFDAHLTDLSTKMGVSKDNLMNGVKDPKNYPEDVWMALNRFNKEVEKERASLVQPRSAPKRVLTSEKKINLKTKRSWVSA